MPNKEDDLAFELANDNLFQRGIIGPFNYVAYRTTMAGLDGEDLVVVQSVMKRAIELWVEMHVTPKLLKEEKRT